MSLQYATNRTFDPFDQTFTIKAPDGVTDIVASLTDVRTMQDSAVNQSICQGVQFGAAIILLIALLLMTKTDKRRSIVFILNASALLFVVIRASLSFAVYTGPFYNLYRNEALYYVNTGGARAVSAVTEVFTFFLTAAIETSLILQVRIVCCNLEPRRRHSINVLNTTVALIATVMRFALLVINIHWGISNLDSETASQAATINTVASAANIMQVASIGVSAFIFCAKLAYAIESRRSMGMTQFGPMQIIFIMGCQTMCTPRKSSCLHTPAQSLLTTDTRLYSHLHNPRLLRRQERPNQQPRPLRRRHLPSTLSHVGRCQHPQRPHRDSRCPQPSHSRRRRCHQR